MTEEHKASRTIVKSPPELWAECSVAQSLARHLGEFGEIRITRLEPETTVAWEGEHASGTVRLEPSGWGTQVTLTATPIVAAAPEPEVAPLPEAIAPEPEAIKPEPEAIEPEMAEVEAPEVEATEAVDEVEASDEEIAEQLPRWQVFARLWARLGRKPVSVALEDAEAEDGSAAVADEPAAAAEESEVVLVQPEAVPEDPQAAPEDEPLLEEPAIDPQALLVGALDSLGQAHHRPFSRA
jgi:hypothetical protein